MQYVPYGITEWKGRLLGFLDCAWATASVTGNECGEQGLKSIIIRA